MEHCLHQWVAFLVVPVFAFANAGVSLSGLTLETLLEPVPLDISADRLGILLGSGLSAFAGYFILRFFKPAAETRPGGLSVPRNWKESAITC